MDLGLGAEDIGDDTSSVLVGEDLGREPFYSSIVRKRCVNSRWALGSINLPFSRGGTCDRFPPALAPF